MKLLSKAGKNRKVSLMLNIGCCLALGLASLGLAIKEAKAWGDHRLASYPAFAAMPEVTKAAEVKVEPLENFLIDQTVAIAALLQAQDQWAKDNLDVYPPLPRELAFVANKSRQTGEWKKDFATALRISPLYPFALFYAPDMHNMDSDPFNQGRTRLPYTTVSTLPDSSLQYDKFTFLALKEGEAVPALAVVATGSEEPDYGVDIGLWSDSKTDYGQATGFGPQPFGNPNLSYSSQAPFHMGFYHESSLFYKAAPFIKKTYPLLRVHQFSTLAALAFKTNHPYWGWRFAGMACHYVQDLTQPFHARLSPGDGTAKLLAINTLAMTGWDTPKNNLVTLLSNRHVALENYQGNWLYNDTLTKQKGNAEKALADIDSDGKYSWTDRYVRDVVSQQAVDEADRLVDVLRKTLPAEIVDNPKVDFGLVSNQQDLYQIVKQGAYAAGSKQLDDEIALLLVNFGSHSRNVVRSILKASQ